VIDEDGIVVGSVDRIAALRLVAGEDVLDVIDGTGDR
jgi:hypothetical protein